MCTHGLLAFFLACIPACLPAFLLVCLFACFALFPACLLAFLLAFLLTFFLSCFLACLFVCLFLAFFLSCLLFFLLACLHSCLLSSFLACLLVCLFACLLVSCFLFSLCCLLAVFPIYLRTCTYLVFQGEVVTVYLDRGELYVPETVQLFPLPSHLHGAVRWALAHVLDPTVDHRDEVFAAGELEQKKGSSRERSLEMQVGTCICKCTVGPYIYVHVRTYVSISQGFPHTSQISHLLLYPSLWLIGNI